MSPVLDVRDAKSRKSALPEVATAVSEGSLVVLPTDTVYGLGCDAFSASAVMRVLAAKGRGRDMPVAVLVPTLDAVDGLAAEVPAYARALMEKYWPGPLTLILKAQPTLTWDLGESDGTVGLRQPDDEIALALLKAVGPMAVTSANRTGIPAASSVLEAATQLGSAVEYYLDGGPRAEALPSTIVDCTGPMPVVLREGAIVTHEIDGIATAIAASTPTTPESTGLSDDEPLTDDELPGSDPATSISSTATSSSATSSSDEKDQA